MASVKIGSLCTGGGGLDMAAHALYPHAELAWTSEVDKHACQVITARFPSAPNIGSCALSDWTGIPPVDIVIGGVPCQPFSSAGKQQGANDARDLLWTIPHLARDMGPSLILLENVAALVRAPEWASLLGRLADVGYDARWGVVRASDVGAAHQRARVFAAAYPHGSRRWEEPGGAHADEGEHGRRPTLDHHQPQRAGEGRLRAAGVTLLPTPTATVIAEDQDPEVWLEQRKKRGAKWGFGAALDLTRAVQLLPTPTVSQGRNATAARGPGAKPAQIGTTLQDVAFAGRWGDYAPAIARHEDAFGHPAPEPVDDRARLRPAFVEWLMMWPPGWVTDLDLPRTAQLRILGNGVVPPQAHAAYTALGVAARHPFKEAA